ncbi:MAG: tyrosine--tRNA ligase, partial [Pseudomonadota bacterium]
ANDARFVDNGEWLDGLEYIPFLREIGQHFSIGRMLSFDSVRLRLEREQPLSFLEFNYMILQAYDFVQLARRYDCQLQMGGSDQWGNIINGIELGRRMDGRSLFALTSPLLTTQSGEKMGKTAQGAIWLSADHYTPYEYWQFWRNSHDGDVGRFLRLFTELPLEEIARLEQLQGAELNEAKIILANEATSLCHGRKASQSAEASADTTFRQGEAGADLPVCTIQPGELDEGVGLLNLIKKIGFSKTNSEARRLIQQGAVRVNDRLIEDEKLHLQRQDFQNGMIKLAVGRKRHGIIRLHGA